MTTNDSLLENFEIQDNAINHRISVAVANEKDREQIYRIRHDVYSTELGQHSSNPTACLRDALDADNVYLVTKIAGRTAGFISITPPGRQSYSIDKYFAREALPFAFDGGLFEIRLLTVLKNHRGGDLAMLLMYAAFRWVESHGGSHVVAIGRREILDLYLKGGLQMVGKSAHCGAVTYDLLHARVSEIRATVQNFRGMLARLESKVCWQLSFGFRKPAACFHGGGFFKAIGERFEALHRKDAVINTDVLDAWFPPSPFVTSALTEHLEWLLRTSPPASCQGLIESIAEARDVSTANILPGAGSSDLIFRALRHWLSERSHVLILDPTYGEYAHVLEQVISCTVDRLPLFRSENYDVDLNRLSHALKDHYDLVVLVNPNSPTGRHIPRAALVEVLRQAPLQTRVWVDETYIDYVGTGESLEAFAAKSENIIVCKSMSKVYALSGARVAYLCAGAHQLEGLRAITPPWVVSLPSQVAATKALQDPIYYAGRYTETHSLREELSKQLEAIGWDVVPGTANFLLAHLPERGPSAPQLILACQRHGLYLRDVSSMGVALGSRGIRVAVKNATINTRMVNIIQAVQSNYPRPEIGCPISPCLLED